MVKWRLASSVLYIGTLAGVCNNTRWVCTRCRRCCYYCVLCTVSVAVLLVVTGSLGVNKMILFRAGLVHGDELAADIPLETQGKVEVRSRSRFFISDIVGLY